MPGPASLATGAVFVDGDKHQQPTPVQLTPNPVNDHQPDGDLRHLDDYTTTDCTDPNFIISNRNVDAHSLYDHWDDADLRTGSHQHIIKGIDSQLHCFSGTVRKCLGISIFAALLVLPLLCAGFMFNASVHAYNHEQTCGGPELWAGMTQTAWWMNAWWTMIAMMLLAYFGEEYKRPILFLAAFPLIAVAIVISAFICPECGDLIAFIAALVFVVMLLGVIFWPFIAPLVIASILENRKTWVRYYSFKMFYNGFHFTTINPGNTTTWPVNALYAMPPRVCENRECVGGWPDTPPRGVVGLLEDIVVPFQYPGFCASPSSAPGKKYTGSVPDPCALVYFLSLTFFSFFSLLCAIRVD